MGFKVSIRGVYKGSIRALLGGSWVVPEVRTTRTRTLAAPKARAADLSHGTSALTLRPTMTTYRNLPL